MYAEVDETFDARMEAKGYSPRQMQTIARQAVNWPTARSEDGESCGNHPGATDSLTDAIRMWPTPQERDHRSADLPGSGNYQRKIDAGWTIDLNSTAAMWTTPQAHDAVGGKTPEQLARHKAKTGSGARNLNEDIHTIWKTPSSAEPGISADRLVTKDGSPWTPGQRAYDKETGRLAQTGIMQVAEASLLSPPDPVTQDGPPSSEPDRTSPLLWPTARTADERDGRGAVLIGNGYYRPSKALESGELVGQANLADVAQMWPTASASVANDGETLESWKARQQRNIEKHYNGNGMGTPLTVAATGWKDQKNEKRRLNPRFVEWLMGFPPGYTEIP